MPGKLVGGEGSQTVVATLVPYVCSSSYLTPTPCFQSERETPISDTTYLSHSEEVLRPQLVLVLLLVLVLVGAHCCWEVRIE